MAVTQISRIQLRRGKKFSATGVPQLAGGEMAWAVDSQELYIGNGSVTEGAPYVGNTRILTEHDDLSLLISGQRFAASSPTITLSVSRSIQNKLDDTVSLADFFLNTDIGDGITDASISFQNALNQLYRNPVTTFRKPLFIPNGIYVFDNDIEIPSYAIIRGESRDGVIFRLGSSDLKVIGDRATFAGTRSSNILTVTDMQSGILKIGQLITGPNLLPETRIVSFVTGSGGTGTYIVTTSQNLNLTEMTATDPFSTNIEISNITVEKNSTGYLDITGSQSILIKNVKFIGDYELGDHDPNWQSSQDPVIRWVDQLLVTTTDVHFVDCDFNFLDLAIRSSRSIEDKVNIYLTGCDFRDIGTAIYINGEFGQKTIWNITKCQFKNIPNYAIYSSGGQGVLIDSCEFENCGNDLDGRPQTASIWFTESTDNILVNCRSDRSNTLREYLITTVTPLEALSEVYNSNSAEFVNRNLLAIEYSASPRRLILFGLDNRTIKINYSLNLKNSISELSGSRIGILTIVISDDLSQISMTDQYNHSSVADPDPEDPSDLGVEMTNLEFNIQAVDNDEDDIFGSLELTYKFISESFLLNGNITFNITYGV
jgi:hypothetical protein